MKIFEVLRKIETNIPFTQEGAWDYGDEYAVDRYSFNIDGSIATIYFWVNQAYPSAIYKRFYINKFDEMSKNVHEAKENMEKIGGSYLVEFDVDGFYDITGGGNTTKILSTVIKIISVFVHKHNVKELAFTAKEPSRIKLYNRLTRELPSQIGFYGYKPDDIYYLLKK